MLGKLIKHEFKATSRMILALYAAIAVLTVGNRITLELETRLHLESNMFMAIELIIFLTYVIVMVAGFAFLIIVLIKRFYDNMLKDEGYLSFTLPVKTSYHIISKALVSYVWAIATIIVYVLSVVGLIFEPGVDYMEGITKVINEITNQGMWGYVAQVIVMVLISIYTLIIMIYACMCVGQMCAKHRVGGAIMAFLGFYIVRQIVNSVWLIGRTDIISDVEVVDSMSFASSILNFSIIEMTAEALIFTVITHFILSRKLNLE